MDRLDPIETKFKEAEFFLWHMVALDHPSSETRPIGDEIFVEHTRYYLSAFLGASRSIYQRLDTLHPRSFKSWYDKSWLPGLSPDDRRLYCMMKDERDFEIHLKESTQTRRSFRFVPGRAVRRRGCLSRYGRSRC